MDSIDELFVEGCRAWRNMDFKNLSANIEDDIKLYRLKYKTFSQGSHFLDPAALYQLYTCAFFLREKCEKLTPMMGIKDSAGEKFVEFYYDLTANMRLIDERRHALLLWGEVFTTKYTTGSRASYTSTRTRSRVSYDKVAYLHERMSTQAKRDVLDVLERCAAWRERYEEHRRAIEADANLPRPKSQYIGEDGRRLIRERVACSRAVTGVLIKKTAMEEIDTKTLQRRCKGFFDGSVDLVMRVGNEVLQRQWEIRLSPKTEHEVEELTLLRTILTNARIIEMLCDKHNLDLATARVEASSLVAKLAGRRALCFHVQMEHIVEDDALETCNAIQSFLASYDAIDWYPEHEIDTASLDEAGTKLTMAILVEVLSHLVGIDAEREAQALQDIIGEEFGLAIDGVAQDNALHLFKMFSTTFEACDFLGIEPGGKEKMISWS